MKRRPIIHKLNYRFMKKLNLIPLLCLLTFVFGCKKNNPNTVKPSNATTTNSLMADSVVVYAGSYDPNPNILTPVVANGALSSATFGGPMGMTMDAAGNLYI